MKNKFENTQKSIEKTLAKYVEICPLPQRRVYDAMRYSLLAGGKRLRPVIMLYSCEMCGGKTSDAMPFACAMEMIHTYSLIHDDLPAMDNDDLRRGLPTNHIKFDEATAILAGDALLNMAFEITSSYKNPNIAAENILKAISLLASSAGAKGMIGGQMIDIESEHKQLTLEELTHLHSLKTGAIIRSSGTCGAVLAGASNEQIKAIDDFCLNLGIAFQIQDDILDVVGDEKTLGKKIGSDKQNHKNTYVSLTSLNQAEKLSEEYTKKAKSALDLFEDNAKPLLWLADMLMTRKN